MAYKFSKGNRGLGDIAFEDDADTGIDFESDTIKLETNGVERLVVNNDGVGIGNSSPATLLHLEGTEPTITFSESNTEKGTIGINSSDNILIENKTMNKHIVFKVNDQGVVREGLRLDGAVPEVVVNEGSESLVDFRVESNSETHMLFVDGGNNKVGIGTDGPVSTLHIEHVDTTTWPLGGTSNETYSDFLLTLRNNTDTIDAFAGIAFDISTETDSDSIGAAIIAQCADATSTQHDTDLIFATNQISDDDLTERMRITHDGRIGFGTPDPELNIDATYAMYANHSDSYCLKLHNDGDSNNRRGLYIACGSDDSLGTNYAVAFADGNDTWQGSIKFTGGTVSYMAFTAAHPAEIPEGHSYDYGTIVCVTSTTSNNRSIVYNVTKSTSAEQASVLGCYSDDNGGVEGPPARHSVCAVGDGHVLVCSEGGNIAIGDYICSSATAGHGMKQSSDGLMNYTVAKAFEAVDWSTESETTKLIACTYHCG